MCGGGVSGGGWLRQWRWWWWQMVGGYNWGCNITVTSIHCVGMDPIPPAQPMKKYIYCSTKPISFLTSIQLFITPILFKNDENIIFSMQLYPLEACSFKCLKGWFGPKEIQKRQRSFRLMIKLKVVELEIPNIVWIIIRITYWRLCTSITT